MDERLRGLPSYSYARFRWIEGLNVDRVAEGLSEEYEVRPINTPEPSEGEISIHKTTRREIIIKADTVGAIISTFRAILYQKEKALFTNRDLMLRKEILELYPRRSASPLPIGYSYEPEFITEDPNAEI